MKSAVVGRLWLQTIVKLKLIAPVLDILFPIICDFSSDDEEDTEAADVDAQSPSSCALQVTSCLCFALFVNFQIQFVGNF